MVAVGKQCLSVSRPQYLKQLSERSSGSWSFSVLEGETASFSSGVPQGYMLDSLHFCIHTLILRHIVHRCIIYFNCCANETQLYVLLEELSILSLSVLYNNIQ